MRQQKNMIAAAILLSSQMVSQAGASPSISADAPLVVAPASLTDLHAGGINVSTPSLIVPGGGDSSAQTLTIPGGVTTQGGSLPAINSLSVSPRDAAAAAAAKANAPSAAFLCPATATEISTKFGTLNILPGSLVLLVSADDAVSVYDLHDGKNNAVFVESDGHKLALTPGKHVTLARPQCTNFAAANKLPFVVYSSTEVEKINDGLMCFRGVYDINSLIFRYAPFKALLVSQDPNMRRTAEKVLKTASIMSQLTAAAKYYNLKASPPPTTVVK